MGRVALIGSNGQLGTDIMRLWGASSLSAENNGIVGLVHADIEVQDPDQVRSVLNGIQPTAVINTAAFHRVDDGELTPTEALSVNSLGVKNLAETCRELGAALLHVSTDYVFDGASGSPYDESDSPSPVSAYGVSKAAGEQFLRYLLPNDHILVRSSGLYGTAGASGKGGNFVETMLKLAAAGKSIRVVNDQVLSPTYTPDLAETILDIIAKNGRGTFHVTNSGQCSWFEFAAEIFAQSGAQASLSPVTSAEYGALTRRPAYSVLRNSRLSELPIPQLRPWQQALTHYLTTKERSGP